MPSLSSCCALGAPTFTSDPTLVDTGSTVVLTGVGAKGQVGEVVARAFADLGASLVLVDRTTTNVDERAAELNAAGHSARGYACDLTNADAVASLVADVRRNHGDRLGALVHMAGGFGMSGPVAESSLDVWQRQIAINLTTAYLTTRAFLPMLRAGKGAIVLFASEAAIPGSAGANRSAYAVAKTGVVTLMRVDRQRGAKERRSGKRIGARRRFVPPRTSRRWARARGSSSAKRSRPSSRFSVPTRRVRSPANCFR